ncbi:MAG: recombinase zinc beta ribbon domain-containing protein, partial [Bacteroidia bacterium]
TKRNKEGFKNYTINYILRNSLYIGQRRFKGEVFELPELQIISNETFNKAQTILDSSSKKLNMGKKHTYLLDNRLIKCGVCGKSFYAHTSNPHSLTGAGNQYKCISKKYNDSCGNYGISIQKLESSIKQNIEKYFNNDMIQVLDKQNFVLLIESKKSTIVDLELQAKKFEIELERNVDAYINVAISKAKYIEKKQAIELKQAQNYMKQTQLRSEVTNLEYESNIPEYSELNRDVLQKLVQSIVIFPVAKGELSLKQKNDKAVKVVLTVLGRSIEFYLSHYTNMNEVLNTLQLTA